MDSGKPDHMGQARADGRSRWAVCGVGRARAPSHLHAWKVRTPRAGEQEPNGRTGGFAGRRAKAGDGDVALGS